MLIPGEADIGVATEALAGYEPLVTLHDLAQHPIITCELGYTGRSHIDEAFARAGLQPEVVLQALEVDQSA